MLGNVEGCSVDVDNRAATPDHANELIRFHSSPICIRKQLVADTRVSDKRVPHAMRKAVMKLRPLIRGSRGGQSILLAPHQWIEVRDATHRYGGYLKHYWREWASSGTTQDFFHWLDSGDGAFVDLAEAPRAKMETATVTYCSPEQRLRYAVGSRDGLLVYLASGVLVGAGKHCDSRLMYVLSPSGVLYIGEKVKGRFHHSSFLSGGACIGAGYVDVHEGKLLRISPHSGHYRPTASDLERVLHVFGINLGIDMRDVVIDPIEKSKQKKSESE